MSNLTSVEVGKEPGDQNVVRHDPFYFRDGNVEILCGTALFRIHSSIVSFSSSKLDELLSESALLDAPAPEGRPRITLADSAGDFAILMKMIYKPG